MTKEERKQYVDGLSKDEKTSMATRIRDELKKPEIRKLISDLKRLR